ncbi:MAG: LamG domain-containing protein [Akkermansiaceae bacterium]|nr:LamG domain-containing protein [Akkermansiaceae bacterium]NNM29652.1 LamG domain-containing protein [Akkermansiaceae bacterium]
MSYWNFDESDTGTGTAFDQEDSNDGVFEGAAIRATGLIGAGAASFTNTNGDGVNVGAGTSNNFSTTSGITIEALIDSNWSGAFGDYDEIFRKEDGSNRMLFSFQHDNGPQGPVLSFGLNVGGAYGELDMALDGVGGRPTLAQITTGVHHVVATYDMVTGAKSIWYDGANVHTIDLGGLSIASGGGADALIGNDHTALEPFSGIIDEVAFYSHALSAAEISLHYDRVRAGNNYFTPLPEPSGALLSLVAMTLLSLPRRRPHRG